MVVVDVVDVVVVVLVVVLLVEVVVLLVVLLMFFIMSYYVNPICRMEDGIDNYLKFNKKYTCTVDGDDELVAINNGVSEIVEENMELKKRLAKLREERERLIESSENRN